MKRRRRGKKRKDLTSYLMLGLIIAIIVWIIFQKGYFEIITTTTQLTTTTPTPIKYCGSAGECKPLFCVLENPGDEVGICMRVGKGCNYILDEDGTPRMLCID